MAKLRKAVCYRRLERPYTRKSKYRQLSFIKAAPRCIIVRFDMGSPKKQFEYNVDLIAEEGHQIRQNSIESARKVVNKILEKKVLTPNYHFQIRVYPHHVLRENPLASGAGADRLSKGMKQAFGKSIGLAARVMPKQIIFRVRVNKDNIDTAKMALKKARVKLPLSYRVVVSKAN